MIFNIEYDNSLYIILLSDIVNRENISRIIYNIPCELLEKIKFYLDKNEKDIGSKQYKCVKRDKDNNLYMYVINIFDSEIKIIYNKWSNNLEEKYKLSLCPFKDNIIMEYPRYLGNYDEMRSNVFCGTVLVREKIRDYEIEKDTYLGSFVSLSDDPNRYWIVSLKNKDMKLNQEDLKDKNSLNKLVRRRKK